MRRRGKIFKDFKNVEGSNDPIVKALAAINENLLLVMELLADTRANTIDPSKIKKASFTPKPEKKEEEK
jgi:hypothetical protein